jgi:thiamine kinase-like enzyme
VRVVESATVIATVEPELRAKLRACAATRSLADGCLTPIVGGLSNRAWRLDTSEARWFVRLGHPLVESLGVDRRSECAALRTAAAAGLAPDVLVCEPADGLLVTRFVDGRTWSAADARSPGNVRRVAACMRRLHGLPVPDGVHEVDYGRQAGRLAAALPDRDANGAVLAQRAAAAFARIGGRYATTLCHNDLHHLNLLDDGNRLWLVDWEYGGRGNPLFDVASFLALHDLGPALTEAFLESYGRLPPVDRSHLDDARWLFDYVQWLWYRTRFPQPVGDEAWYAERLAQKLLRCNN